MHRNFRKPVHPTRVVGRSAAVRPVAIAAALLFGAISLAQAQSLGRTEGLTREQTVDLIAHVLADVQSNFPSPAQALSLELTVVQKQLAMSTTMIRTFSIDLPSGVTVEFDFPPEDRGE